MNGVTAVIDGTGTVTASAPYEIDEDGEVTFTFPFELKAKIDPRGLTGASRPATLRMNVALGIEGFPGSAGVSEGEWNKLSTKEWKAELK